MPQRRSILVVDDDDEVRDAICSLLSLQYDVSTAVDGIDGYEKAVAQAPPDLIISDVSMPRLDGIAMIRRIREHSAFRRVRVIFLTGQVSAPNMMDALCASPFAYLPRTTDPGILEEKVKRALASG